MERLAWDKHSSLLQNSVNYGRKTFFSTGPEGEGSVLLTDLPMFQVIPMEEFNLHLTGDIHAITAANNLVSVLYNIFLCC
jgi:hypothetical protein